MLLPQTCATGTTSLLDERWINTKKAGGEKGTLHIDALATGTKYGGKSFEEVYEDLMNNSI